MSELTERTKRQIALLVGDDLDAAQQAEARRSVENCPLCRHHWVRLRDCLDVIEGAGKSVDVPTGTSLWPRIEPQLRSTAVVRRSERFNGWVPALSMAAACISLLIAGQHDGFAPDDFAASRYVGRSQGKMLPGPSGFSGQRAPGSAGAGMVGYHQWENVAYDQDGSIVPSEQAFPVDATAETPPRGVVSPRDWPFSDRGR